MASVCPGCGGREQRDFLDKLVAQVARLCDVTVAEIRAGSRRRAVVDARALLAWIGKAHVGLPTRTLVSAAGVTPVSVRRFLDRRKVVVAESGIEAEELLLKCSQ